MRYQNPVIRGMYPDPSICRKGEDYYLVCSSFEYFPGIPVFHSKDLVNWEQTGNCITSKEQLSLEEATDSGGIWAPTIRYDRGKFYVTATLEGRGNFIVWTEDPTSVWSLPVWVPVGGIDPSLFLEEDRAYYCTNESLCPDEEQITLEEINLDTGELMSEQRTIWKGIGGGFLEAPHIYHIGEWYYLMAAEGGTNFNHMITMARSRSIWGPYEDCPGNPVLTNVHDTGKEVQCSGHGDLFQDHYGSWWIVHLGIRLARRTMSHLGRETFLTPVVWQHGWPAVEPNRRAVLNAEGPLWQEQNRSRQWTADFTGNMHKPQWCGVRRLPQVTCEDGRLLLYPGKERGNGCNDLTCLLVRQPDFTCELEISLRWLGTEPGDEAGILLRLKDDFYIRFGVKRKHSGECYLMVNRRAEDMHQMTVNEAGKLSLEQEFRLRVCADKEIYRFYYMDGKGGWSCLDKASTRFLACETSGRCFTGTTFGVYCAGREREEAVAAVETVRVTAIPQPD